MKNFQRVKPQRVKPRQGVTILETLVSAVLVASLLTMTVESVVAIGRQRRVAQQRAVAQQTVANMMERLHERAWPELTENKVDRVELDEATSTFLPAAEINIQVAAEPNASETSAAKRITIVLAWQTVGGAPASARLTAWRFREEPSR